MARSEEEQIRGLKILVLDTSGYLRVQRNALENDYGAELLTLDSADPEQACRLIETESVAVIMALLERNPEPELAVLEAVMEEYPDVIRIILTGQLTMRQAFRASDVVHHALLDTCSGEELTKAITTSQRLHTMLHKPDILRYMSVLHHIPELPEVYLNLRRALRHDNLRPRQVADLLTPDTVAAEHLLEMVNSNWYGAHREVQDMEEAAELLGSRTLRDMLLASHLFAAFPQSETWKSFAFSHLHHRSMLVGKAAQHLCKAVKARPYVQSQAFLAGLLHDFGIQVLAARSPGAYQEIMAEAVSLDQPLYALEKLEFGITHAEVGAHLLYKWNLPLPVIEAVLFHHFPSASHVHGFSVLTAVHVTDALVRTTETAMGCSLSSRLNNAYIEREGMEKPLMAWQILVADFQEEVMLGME